MSKRDVQSVLLRCAMALLAIFSVPLAASLLDQVEQRPYVVYLIRHAEKLAESQSDPVLTECGENRALALAQFFAGTGLEQVYSSGYRRTDLTAMPIAAKASISVQLYDPSQLSRFAEQLKQSKQNVLVVGHSNTTPQLASILSGVEYTSLDELQFGVIFQIVFIGERVFAQRFEQTFSCKG